MSSIESIVRFNAQTAGREKLIRLCQYTSKFVNSILLTYYRRQAKGGVKLLELIYKLRELEQYFISCRRVINFGRCTDQLYSALRMLHANDPVIRMTLFTSKLWLSLHMFSDHILWLHQFGVVTVQKEIWTERANTFWLYSVSLNLLRDIYELINVIQKRRTRNDDNLDIGLKNFSLSTPLRWAITYPKLSCDLIKNSCDFWIPYSNVNKIKLHPGVIAMLGIISTTMGILQVYDKNYRLSPM